PELQRVRPIERLGLEPPLAADRCRRDHPYPFGVSIVRRQRRLEIAGRGLAGKTVEVDRNAHQHAPPEIADRGNKDRPPGELGKSLQLGKMLVAEIETIDLE